MTFYRANPTLHGHLTGFKFSTNQTNLNNHLHNGDVLWAKFNNVVEPPNLAIPGQRYDLVVALPPVAGLTERTDPMHPLWYILLGLTGVVTLGVFTALYL